MAQTINIRRDVSDPFYRYKMEKLQSKIEGKGNGIKSVIVNLSSVAASLSRPPVYLVKFFGFELGAQTNTGDNNDRWIINGAHEASKLQDYLDSFITKFVLCKECKNPETDLSISKDQQIIRNCKACGQRTMVESRGKLSSYILKNPPKKDKKSKSKKDKKADKNGDENGEKGSNSEEDGQNGNGHSAIAGLDQYAGEAGSDDELTRRIRAEAATLPAADGPTDAKDEDWSVDVSAEAVKARAKDLPTDLKRALVINEDDDEAEGEEGGNTPYDQLGAWVVEEKENGDGIDDVEIYKKASDLGIASKHKTLTVLAQTLFDDNLVKQIPERADILKKVLFSLSFLSSDVYSPTTHQFINRFSKTRC